jgi:uncharacterized protein involved in exopolysaccharide biosynthesis
MLLLAGDVTKGIPVQPKSPAKGWGLWVILGSTMGVSLVAVRVILRQAMDRRKVTG